MEGLLVPPSEPLEDVAMDTLSLLPKLISRHQIVFVIADRYRQIWQAIATGRIAATAVATIYVDQQISNFSVSSTIPTDSSLQFKSKFFQAIRTDTAIKLLKTTEYHAKSNWQVQQSNATVNSWTCHYLATPQRACDSYVAQLAYVYSNQIHLCTKQKTVCPVPGRRPARLWSPTPIKMPPDVNNMHPLLAMWALLFNNTVQLGWITDRRLLKHGYPTSRNNIKWTVLERRMGQVTTHSSPDGL